MKYKKVNGKTYKPFPGAPALWYTEGENKRYSSMELEHLKKKKRRSKK